MYLDLKIHCQTNKHSTLNLTNCATIAESLADCAV